MLKRYDPVRSPRQYKWIHWKKDSAPNPQLSKNNFSMMTSNGVKYLGIDYGTKRIGIAISDDTGALAFPLATLGAGEGAAKEVLALAREHGAQKIIIGESRNFHGAPNPVMKEIEAFAEGLRAGGAEVVLEPEFMTSAGAARQFAPDGSRKANPSQERIDAAAAALILQSFLDRQKPRPGVE